jgi:hypothetical protein
MQTLTRAFKNHGDWFALAAIGLALRLYLLSVYDVELSQDGFEAVRTLTIWQTQGASAIPRDLLDRFILHPLYMLLLGALRLITPATMDFYFIARLLSSLIACAAIVALFEFTRRAHGRVAAWVAALFLACAPSFLWESVSILSSTLFLALYLAVLLALLQSRYRLAASFALLATLTRYEGVALLALTFVMLFARDAREREFRRDDWLVCLACALAFPLTLMMTSALATGNALQFLGSNSMAAIWLRFLAPGDFSNRAGFFITRYPALFPAALVWLGIGGAVIAILRQRTRATGLLFLTTALCLLFFETLVWLNYTTLEVRFLMYPGLPLLVFAGLASDVAFQMASKISRPGASVGLTLLVIGLGAQSYRQGDAGMQFVYNSQSSMREMAAELAQFIPPHQPTNVLTYGGTSGALDLFARQRGIELSFTEFRFAPDNNPEQYIIDNRIRFVIYPVGNAFAKAKYPYLARFETQTHGAVTFVPLTQFATTTDKSDVLAVVGGVLNDRRPQTTDCRQPSAGNANPRQRKRNAIARDILPDCHICREPSVHALQRLSHLRAFDTNKCMPRAKLPAQIALDANRTERVNRARLQVL